MYVCWQDIRPSPNINCKYWTIFAISIQYTVKHVRNITAICINELEFHSFDS